MSVSFLRTKTVSVEPAGEGLLQAVWRLVDDLLQAELHLTVKPPDLEIVAAEVTVCSSAHPGCQTAADDIGKVIGVRIGPGLRKIVSGLLPTKRGADQLVQGVLEACNAIILHFTLPHIRAGERMTDEQRRQASRMLLEHNPRMLGSCVAWQPGSPLLEWLKVEAGGEA